jgi:hypothetical protein
LGLGEEGLHLIRNRVALHLEADCRVAEQQTGETRKDSDGEDGDHPGVHRLS